MALHSCHLRYVRSEYSHLTRHDCFRCPETWTAGQLSCTTHRPTIDPDGFYLLASSKYYIWQHSFLLLRQCLSKQLLRGLKRQPCCRCRRQLRALQPQHSQAGGAEPSCQQYTVRFMTRGVVSWGSLQLCMAILLMQVRVPVSSSAAGSRLSNGR
jgi:hypothetical protein